MADAILSAERVREIFNYDPETGVMTWREKIARRIVVGEEVGTYSHGYRTVTAGGARYPVHRLAWVYMTGHWPVEQIDHIDGDRSNNRFANLREATNQDNQQNRRTPHRDNKSGYQGVSWNVPGRRWTARICVNRQARYLGLFDTPEEAHAAYLKAKRELHEFCTL